MSLDRSPSKSEQFDKGVTASKLREIETGRIVIANVEIARGFFQSGLGLLGRSTMPSGTGFALPSCNAIHTVGMRFRIDVMFLNRAGKALKISHDVGPWRARGPVIGAKWVVETPAGDLIRQNVKVGCHYEIITP